MTSSWNIMNCDTHGIFISTSNPRNIYHSNKCRHFKCKVTFMTSIHLDDDDKWKLEEDCLDSYQTQTVHKMVNEPRSRQQYRDSIQKLTDSELKSRYNTIDINMNMNTIGPILVSEILREIDQRNIQLQ